METKVINLFGAPCSGKSTCAAELFSTLKRLGKNCELVTEFAKDLVYNEDKRLLKDQLIVLGEQYRRVFVLQNKVEFIITDSPILLSAIYNEVYQGYSDTFNLVTIEAFKRFNNINFLLYPLTFKQEGRIQTKEEADNIQINIINLLKEQSFKYTDLKDENKRIETILTRLQNDN